MIFLLKKLVTLFPAPKVGIFSLTYLNGIKLNHRDQAGLQTDPYVKSCFNRKNFTLSHNKSGTND